MSIGGVHEPMRMLDGGRKENSSPAKNSPRRVAKRVQKMFLSKPKDESFTTLGVELRW